ncbi:MULTISPECIES: methionine--tRNA ligase [unclassified Novosphingobium]|uniref:methionine--tRNA ligase n=1 Tax=unclassified Novosphingobium TaxID=2644732 RepID=UPI00146E253A|nr:MULTISPECIES: methionine--tRNA ligase [unclassified Novosphingobium]NMN04376.1 methionyl-tRNA synthetase [Novosphingobium sp. SG919]NMN85633.1 methionyl-tRNA synthetase [Novosphingobium sp. SG916]
MGEPYYITTAISYPNGKPHIGHAYEAIAADVIARFHKAMGRDVRLQTGTDEHGLKMAQKARDLDLTPAQLSDQMSQHFIDMAHALNVNYDVFLRTTEPRHHTASQEIWKRMEANGDLYLDRYEGWYSVRDEAYYDESELIEGEGGAKLSPQGTPVEWTVEESWFFRLSKYQDKLLALYTENPDFIRPEARRNEMIAFVSQGLRDLSVSRTSFDWGVKVPGSDNHVMYVWVDALTNYLTGLGWPEKTDAFAKYWPANLHLIGKDIVRFHTIYWPAFLMSAGLPVPRQVFGHGFLLNRGQKESKSLGNVTDPIALAETFGVDAVRYFFMREVAFGQDGSWSPDAIVTRCNAELANSYGNLVQRVLSMIFKNMDGKLDTFSSTEADDTLLATVHGAAAEDLPREFAALNFSAGIEAWMRAVFACNAYIDEQAPWTLRKTDPERMRAVLLTLFMAIRDLTIAIAPVVPTAAGKVLDQLGIPAEQRGFGALGHAGWYMERVATGEALAQPVGAFPRLELPAEEGASA